MTIEKPQRIEYFELTCYCPLIKSRCNPNCLFAYAKPSHVNEYEKESVITIKYSCKLLKLAEKLTGV